MNAKTYRDLKVCAIGADGVKSDAFYVRQDAISPKVERLVLRLDPGKPNAKGEPQINTNNGEHRVFGNQNSLWLNEKMVGFRRKVGDVVVVVVEVQGYDIPSEKELAAIELF